MSVPTIQLMKIAIIDPTSGIAGDMFLGALVDVGLDKAWLESESLSRADAELTALTK